MMNSPAVSKAKQIHDGFGLVDRIADEPLLVEPVCCAPVKALPSPAPIVQRQPHQGEDRLVDLVVVDLHAGTLPCHDRRFRSLRRMRRMKERLKAKAPPTLEAPEAELKPALGTITAQDAKGWIRHAGYALH